VPIFPSHHGRGQHGCGDQPSRQNIKSGHFSFSNGYRSQNILASDLEMSGANGGLNEKLVYGRSPLREVGGGNDHKSWRDRHVPLRANGPSAVKILFTVPREFFKLCETRTVPTSASWACSESTCRSADKKHESSDIVPDWSRLGRMSDLSGRL
jgi:hypothetical protein